MSKKDSVEPRSKQKNEAKVASRIRIIIKCFDSGILDEACKIIIANSTNSEAQASGPTPLPTEKQSFVVNRSTFKHKTAKEKYCIFTHKRLIDLKNPTADTVTSLQNLTLPSGVGVEIKMI